ncbi:MAG: hypothetical protein QF393_17720 [Rhodospirillales bacterium]|jgi:predicted transcriptional regulator|nr:hypothetical protein [Rhodospirillales bacterium]MDP6643053.1 hypothetical protein [Rhodospirillales bacterium]|tara:strand:- start:112 stop:324 length:213 start_codon:yes stop_codon:yes gene_type:complete
MKRKINTETITFRLPESLRTDLRSIADQTNHHESDLIRSALSELVARFQTQKPTTTQTPTWSPNGWTVSP